MARRQAQSTLPALPHEDPAAARLRARNSLGHELPFIPRYKSIDGSAPLADLLSDGTASYIGETGLVPATSASRPACVSLPRGRGASLPGARISIWPANRASVPRGRPATVHSSSPRCPSPPRARPDIFGPGVDSGGPCS